MIELARINEVNDLFHSSLDIEYRKFISSSIILYTETLNDFLFAFSSIETTLGNSDMKIINEIMGIYQSQIERRDLIIYDLISLSFLNDLATGKITVILIYYLHYLYLYM